MGVAELIAQFREGELVIANAAALLPPLLSLPLLSSGSFHARGREGKTQAKFTN